jgi:hypothetical protein
MLLEGAQMWQVQYQKVFPSLNSGAVWKVWSDVDHWREWDEDIEYTKLSGPFVAGGELTLKPKGGPKVRIRLSEVHPVLAWLWRKLVAEKVAAGIPRQMEALARYTAGKADAP